MCYTEHMRQQGSVTTAPGSLDSELSRGWLPEEGEYALTGANRPGPIRGGVSNGPYPPRGYYD